MGYFTRLRGGEDDSTLYECRNCGTSLQKDAGACSTCGSHEIATYQF